MLFAVCGLFIFLFSSGAAAADPPREARPSAVELQEEAKALDDTWLEEKRKFKGKFEALIDKVERSIQDREKTVDAGDAKFRKRLTEERKDLERQRDLLKRRLAEVSAANFIDWSKIRENIHDKIQDLKD